MYVVNFKEDYKYSETSTGLGRGSDQNLPLRSFTKETIMSKLKLAVLAIALGLAGCASNDYRLYADTQMKIAQANRDAEIARYQALAKIAETGDSASKVAAVISLNMAGGGAGPRQVPVNPPQSLGDKALQWTSVLLPSLTQFYSINANRQVAITQSNNATAVAQSTNSTFAAMNAAGHNANVAISGQGFTAVTGVANAGLTATSNVATAGIAQVGTTAANGLTAATNISTSANTAITNVSNAANTSIQAISATIPQIQPNVTTTTNTSTTTTNNTTTAPTAP